ncbi:MAG: MBOAT family protein, partial [Clostridia bacterium]|nr:MBOAT family protein [Clostridia bacterium]
WHGASWNFIVWGAYFAAILLIEKYLLKNVLQKMPSPILHIYTMLLVIISWVIFRAPDLPSALSYLGTMFGVGAPSLMSGDAVYYIRQFLPEWILFIVCALPVTKWLSSYFSRREDKLSRAICEIVPAAFALIVFAIGYLRLSVGSFNPFIYFRF